MKENILSPGAKKDVHSNIFSLDDDECIEHDLALAHPGHCRKAATNPSKNSQLLVILFFCPYKADTVDAVVLFTTQHTAVNEYTPSDSRMMYLCIMPIIWLVWNRQTGENWIFTLYYADCWNIDLKIWNSLQSNQVSCRFLIKTVCSFCHFRQPTWMSK